MDGPDGPDSQSKRRGCWPFRKPRPMARMGKICYLEQQSVSGDRAKPVSVHRLAELGGTLPASDELGEA